MQNIAIAKEGDEHKEQCLFFFRINRFELLNKGHVPWAGFLGWSMAHPDHPLATPLHSSTRFIVAVVVVLFYSKKENTVPDSQFFHQNKKEKK